MYMYISVCRCILLSVMSSGGGSLADLLSSDLSGLQVGSLPTCTLSIPVHAYMYMCV